MTLRVVGPRRSEVDVDDEGHRTYKMVTRIESDNGLDGEAAVLAFEDLHQVGDFWEKFDADGNVIDVDVWAFCTAGVKVRPAPEIKNGPVRHYDAEQTFSTKPPPQNQRRCQDVKIEDPLMEPPKVTFGYSKYTEEAVKDRFGKFITNSAFEQLRGPQNEWDDNRSSVTIEQNVATAYLGHQLPRLMANMVNAFPLWGLPARCIKLVPQPTERAFYARCNLYYKRKLEFEINPKTFDRDLLDEGSKALNGRFDGTTGLYTLVDIGGGPPDPTNSSHYTLFQDRNGNPCRCPLDGNGLPAETHTNISAFPLWAIDETYNTGDVVRWNGRTWSSGTDLNEGNVPETIPDWDSDELYQEGERVLYLGFIYEVLTPVSQGDPPDVNVATGIWGQIGPGPIWVDEGPILLLTTGIGSIHVEKYDQTDFLLLGIPTDF